MSLAFGEGMKKDDRNGFFPNSIRAISGYLKIVSSGASNVASTVRSAASGIVDRECDDDQV